MRPVAIPSAKHVRQRPQNWVDTWCLQVFGLTSEGGKALNGKEGMVQEPDYRVKYVLAACVFI